jgi:hypothetical protein
MAITIQYPAIAYTYSGSMRRKGMESSRTYTRRDDRNHEGPVVMADTPEKAARLDAELEGMFQKTAGTDVFYHAAAWLTDAEIRACAKRAACEMTNTAEAAA